MNDNDDGDINDDDGDKNDDDDEGDSDDNGDDGGNNDNDSPVVERSTLLSDQISSFQNLNSGKMLIGTRWWMNLKIRKTFWSLFP